MRLRSLLVVAVALLTAVAGVAPVGAQDVDGRYQDFGDPGGFLNIVPPGQKGVFNAAEAVSAQGGSYPPHTVDQLEMYEQLVFEDATPGVTEEQLLDYFKDASFGVPADDIASSYSPGGRDDVIVVRDASHGVPHIYGGTREGTMFAAGYTGAEDRLFLMDVLRHLGRARLSEFLGPSEGNKAMDRGQFLVAPYTEQDLTDQAETIRAAGDEGAQIAADAEAYAEGVNAYIAEAIVDQRKLPAEYPALQQLPAEWVIEDIIAIASLVGGIFGKGGGGEIGNLCDIHALADARGIAFDEARTIFDDLHFPNDAEAPITTDRRFPYMQTGELTPASSPDVDCATLQPVIDAETDPASLLDAVGEAIPIPPPPGSAPGMARIDGPLGAIQIPLDLGMSNAVLVDAEHTQAGRPIAVFGPQTGYFMPQLLVEKDIHGPGIDARGVSFAGTDIFIQLGRGRDYAWSATSAGGDNIDNWVLELCEPGGGEATVDSMGYVRDGQCLEIESFEHTQIAKPSAGGQAPPEVITFEAQRTEHYGFVLFRGEAADGTPIAVTNDRTTYRNELGSAFGFYRINDPGFMTDGYESFQQAMGAGVDYTFNWFYVDDEDIGYQHSCRCPVRAEGTDPYLPTWGNGDWDWQGFLTLDQQPHEVNPDEGYFTNWNNKQAPGFTANDSNFKYGPIYRNQLLEERLLDAIDAGKVDRGDVVDVMELAGTTDVRSQELVPLLLDALGDTPPSDADERVGEMVTSLRDWAADDRGHRRDHDDDGAYEHPVAPAIMDAWQGGAPDPNPDTPNPNDDAFLVNAVFGDAFEHLGVGIVDSPMLHVGSAFNGGAESHLDKDLRQVLGQDVDDPFSTTYCGDGDLGTCRDALWDSLSATAAALEEDFGSAEVSDWQRVPADDAIVHSAVGVVTVPDIHWVNRPTFQQVIQVGQPIGQAPEATTGGDGTDGGGAPDRAPTPATGGSPPLVVLAAAMLLGALGLRRRGSLDT